MNKLDELSKTGYVNFGDMYPKEAVKRIAIEFAKHILEEAAKNAKVVMVDYCSNHTPYRGECGNCGNYHNSTVASEEIDKESIISTINKYL